MELENTEDTKEVEKFTKLIHDQIKAAIEGRSITPSSLTLTVTAVMVTLNRSTYLTGPKKKHILLEEVRRLLQELPTTDENKTLIDASILLMPALIDSICTAWKGKPGSNDPSGCCIIS